MEKMVRTLGGLYTEAERFVATLAPPKDKATLVTLSGELGAGKTAFAKAIAKALGIEETVTSPTFVLEKIYILSSDKPFKRLIHIDAYRLDGGRDLAPLGFDELMQDPGNLVLLEWPERVANVLPPVAAAIAFTLNKDESRTLRYG